MAGTSPAMTVETHKPGHDVEMADLPGQPGHDD
jgi:hypothetical protein